MLNSQKVEDELNLALDATQSERERSAGLETGYDPKARTWELIVKYSGDLEAARSIAEAVTELSAGYAILLVQENRLEEIRKSQGIKQEELAAALEVSRQTIGSLENGRYNPSIILAFKIARYFNMRIEDIFIYEEDEQ